MTDSQIEATLTALAEAREEIDQNDSALRTRAQVIITSVVMAIWALAAIATLGWIIWSAVSGPEFICDTPASNGSTTGSDCTNRWNYATGQFKEVYAYAILPFVTLVIGFFFGQKSESGN